MTQNKALEALEFIEMAYETTMLREAIPDRNEPHNELVKQGMKAVAHHIEIIRTELKVSNSTPLDNPELLRRINYDIEYFDSDKSDTSCIDYEFGNLELRVCDLYLIRSVITKHAELEMDNKRLKKSLEHAKGAFIEIEWSKINSNFRSIAQGAAKGIDKALKGGA